MVTVQIAYLAGLLLALVFTGYFAGLKYRGMENVKKRLEKVQQDLADVSSTYKTISDGLEYYRKRANDAEARLRGSIAEQRMLRVAEGIYQNHHCTEYIDLSDIIKRLSETDWRACGDGNAPMETVGDICYLLHNDLKYKLFIKNPRFGEGWKQTESNGNN